MTNAANPAVTELLATLGTDVVAVDDISSRYHNDWTGLPPCAPLALVRPRSTEQVAAALEICHRHRQPLVIQGGLTGIAAGAVPRPAEIALNLERMTGIEEIDLDSATMTVWAGTTLAAAQEAALDHGMELTYDLGARGSCTIGGNVATNAGGLRVIRYGMARDHVLGLEVVLADGTVVTSLNKLIKNNTGYDLKQLFIGSEGTLGVVTRAVLRLRPAATSRTTALLACPDYATTLRTLAAFRAAAPNLTAFEVMWPQYYRLLAERREVTAPVDIGAGRGVIVELSGSDDDADHRIMIETIEAAIESGDVADGFVANSHAETEAIWAMRETGPMDAMTGLIHFDLGLPTGAIDTYLEEVDQDLRAMWAGVVLYAFGHVADGNLHLSIKVDSSGELPDAETIHRADEIVYRAVARYNGSISAEHGVGTAKMPYLHHSRTPAEIELMRRIRVALDPHGILNPDRIVARDAPH